MVENFREVSEMLTKMIEEGNHKLEEYKGRKYEIIRVSTTGHLCGYIYFDRPATEKEYEIMDHNFHCGVTWGCDGNPKGGKYGFDCAHSYDLTPLSIFGDMCIFGNETYKDLNFVEDTLKNVIDLLEDAENERS